MPWADMDPRVFYPLFIIALVLIYAVVGGVSIWFQNREADRWEREPMPMMWCEGSGDCCDPDMHGGIGEPCSCGCHA